MKRIAMLLTAALLVGACGGDDETESAEPPAAGEDAVEEPADAEDSDAEDGEWDGPTIPLGTYTKVMDAEEAEADLLALGVSDSVVTEQLSDIDPVDGEIHTTFRIDDGVWAQFMTWRGNHDDLGSRGVYTYSEDGEWVTTEDPCPGEPCTFERSWIYADDVLAFTPDDWAEILEFLRDIDEEWVFVHIYLIFSGEFEKVE